MIKCDKCGILFTDEKTIFIESKYIEEYGVCSKCYCDDLEQTKIEWGDIVSDTLRAHFNFLNDVLSKKNEKLHNIKKLKKD
jgi:hypothetical protein